MTKATLRGKPDAGNPTVSATLGDLVYTTGTKDDCTLTVAAPTTFATPLTTTIPDSWRLLTGSSATLVAAPADATVDLTQITVQTSSGKDVTARCRLLCTDGKLMLTGKGLMSIVR